KVGFPQGDGVNNQGASRRHIQNQVNVSLKRLKTDRIDVYFIHRFDDATPIDATLRALDDLVHQGKILYPAVSNWAAWQIARVLDDSSRMRCMPRGTANRFTMRSPRNFLRIRVSAAICPLHWPWPG